MISGADVHQLKVAIEKLADATGSSESRKLQRHEIEMLGKRIKEGLLAVATSIDKICAKIPDPPGQGG